MKILHTADWHLGTFRSPVKDGVNLRTEDTKRCLDELIRVANEENRITRLYLVTYSMLVACGPTGVVRKLLLPFIISESLRQYQSRLLL